MSFSDGVSYENLRRKHPIESNQNEISEEYDMNVQLNSTQAIEKLEQKNRVSVSLTDTQRQCSASGLVLTQKSNDNCGCLSAAIAWYHLGSLRWFIFGVIVRGVVWQRT